MIYTSYFAKLKSLPDDVVPIAICGKAPSWYQGFQYKKLAPKYGCLMDYKEDHDKEKYTERFQKEVLDHLNPVIVIEELKELVGYENRYKKFCLICYEKPGDFCHRTLVSNWFKEAGCESEEYKWK